MSRIPDLFGGPARAPRTNYMKTKPARLTLAQQAGAPDACVVCCMAMRPRLGRANTPVLTCSQACNHVRLTKDRPPCPVCGDAIERRGAATFCSRLCAARAREARKAGFARDAAGVAALALAVAQHDVEVAQRRADQDTARATAKAAAVAARDAAAMARRHAIAARRAEAERLRLARIETVPCPHCRSAFQRRWSDPHPKRSCGAPDCRRMAARLGRNPSRDARATLHREAVGTVPPAARMTRQQLGDRDGWRCQAPLPNGRTCHRKVVEHPGGSTLPNQATRGHVLALTAGGTDTPNNLRIECWACNVRAGRNSGGNFMLPL